MRRISPFAIALRTPPMRLLPLNVLVPAGLTLLCACSSAPPVVNTPPRVPALEHASPAPMAPMPPAPPSMLPIEAPEMPAIWTQDVADVFGEAYSLDAVPTVLPLGPANVIVASVPPQTAPELRTALLGGFLSGGYLVKDAGSFGEGTFQVDSNVSAPGAFERNVPATGSASTAGTQEKDIPTRTYSGLEAMTLRLDDPTSLWVPDLLSNENLDADYFLRVFELTVEESEELVALASVYDPDEITLYREEVDMANELVETQNQRIARFAREVDDYNQAYATYEVAYDKWAERDKDDHLTRIERYERDWKTWKASQSDAIEDLRQSGVTEASWDRSEAAPSYRVPTIKASKAPLVVAASRPRYDTQTVEDALAYETVQAVPCHRVRVLAEVIEASSGLVVWVGEVNGVAPLHVPRTEVVRRAIRYMSKR